MKFSGRVLQVFVTGMSIIGAAMIFLMMLHITADVIGKNVFNRPLPGTIPIVSQYYMVTIAFVPLALLERQSGQISVEIVFNRFPRSLRGALTVFSTALGIVLFAAMTWATFDEALKKYLLGSFSYEQGIKVPVWPSYFVVPVATALVTVVLVWRLLAQLMKVEDPYNTANEIAPQEKVQTID